MKTLILCDYAWILNRYAFGFKDKFIDKDGEKIFVGTILGFSLLIERVTSKYPDAKIIFCLEGECTKKNLDENYKAQREKKEKIYVNNSVIFNILSNLPKVYFAQSLDHEGDDLIANIAFKYKNNFDEIIIYSGDKDFFQLSNTFKVSQEYKKGFKYVTPNIVFEKFGVATENLLAFRVLDGDASDNLKSPVPHISKDFRRLLAEMWHPLTEESLISTLNLLKGTQHSKSAEKHLLVIDKIMNNLEIMNLTKYEDSSNIFEYNLFRNNSPNLELVQFYELRQFEKYLHDIRRNLSNV